MRISRLLKLSTVTLVLFLSFCLVNLYSADKEKKEVNKVFKAKEIVKLNIVSGDCTIKKGNPGEIKVHLIYDYPADKFTPEFLEEGNVLVLKEKFAQHTGSISGKSSWDLTVPENTRIDFKAASGDFHMEGVKNDTSITVASGDITLVGFKGKLEVKSASGDIDMKGSEGELKIKSASGDIKFENVKGAFEVKSASGNIEGSAIEFTGAGLMEAVSGDIDIKLAKTLMVDMKFATVSGDIELSYNGNPIKGSFEFHGMSKHFTGPFAEENREEGDGHSPFGKWSYSKGGEAPRILFKTVSGSVRIKE